MSLETDSVHGDSATVEAEKESDQLDELQLLGPRKLYFLWENRQWAAGGLDFGQDRRDWASVSEAQRSLLLRSLSPFFAAEERVATAFAPIILAAEDRQEMAFLTTQQVDEARHMQFFDRFWTEVFVGDEAKAAALDDARSRCNWAFTMLFDRRLMDAVDVLRVNPQDTEAKVEAVAIYHLVIEGVLGLTGLHFVIDCLKRQSIFPGITAGFQNVKRDEHRHVAWGTWFLRRKCREDDRYGNIVQRVLLELLPIATSIFLPDGSAICDGLDACDFLGYPGAQLNHFALMSLGRRLKVIGGATEEVQRFVASGVWRAARVL